MTESHQSFLLSRTDGRDKYGDLAAVHNPGRKRLVRQVLASFEPGLQQSRGAFWIQSVRAKLPGRKLRRSGARIERKFGHDAKMTISTATRSPEQVGIFI